VVRGRLWRTADPHLDDQERSAIVRRLMTRRTVRDAKAKGDPTAEAAAHRMVDEAKRALGERGPVWWSDGVPDFNRHMAKNSPYVSWYAYLSEGRRLLMGGEIVASNRGGIRGRYRRSNPARR
jgi:hypothetical protein